MQYHNEEYCMDVMILDDLVVFVEIEVWYISSGTFCNWFSTSMSIDACLYWYDMCK